MTTRALGLLMGFLAAACSPAGSPPPDDVAVEIGALLFDPNAHSPVMILEESAGSRRLPIWIGVSEARSIAAELESVEAIRPNTHDLTTRILSDLDCSVERVTVTELRGGTYFALLQIRSSGRLVEIDSRPSDAIAIALRTSAPVFVRENLFDIVDQKIPDSNPEERKI
jgi:bifunctional DNase/RNase